VIGTQLHEALSLIRDGSDILLELLETLDYEARRENLTNELIVVYHALLSTIDDLEDIYNEYR
jgi:hypothetical protein